MRWLTSVTLSLRCPFHFSSLPALTSFTPIARDAFTHQATASLKSRLRPARSRSYRNMLLPSST